MARRSVTGQLNMFDFFSSAEGGEVEMVSLMPSFEEEASVEPEPVIEPEPVAEPEPVVEPELVAEPESVIEPEPITATEYITESEPVVQLERPVMSRVYEKNGKKIEVAYINYNKVRVTRENAAPELHEFSNSKDAVDYYVGYMQGLEE